VAINTDHHEKSGNIIKLFANLRATYGVLLIGKGKQQCLPNLTNQSGALLQIGEGISNYPVNII